MTASFLWCARQCAPTSSIYYVYDGASSPYYPDSPVHSLNAYGRMKFESEYVAAERALSGILRPPYYFTSRYHFLSLSYFCAPERICPLQTRVGTEFIPSSLALLMSMETAFFALSLW